MKKCNIISILSLLIFVLSSPVLAGKTPVSEKEAKEVKVIFPNASLQCDPSRGSVSIYATSEHPEPFFVGGGKEWQILVSSAGVYYLKNTSWGGNFWQVDVIKRRVTRVSEGAGLTRKPDVPMGFKVEVLDAEKMAFALNFKKLELKFEPKKGRIRLYGDGYIVSEGSDLNQCKINPQLYHLDSRMMTGDSFWKIDIEAKQLIYTTGGLFCESSDEEKDVIWSDIEMKIKY